MPACSYWAHENWPTPAHSDLRRIVTKKLKSNDGQDLSAELAVITSELSESDRTEEQSTRADMLGALRRFTTSRYEFGRTLAAYKKACRIERVWMRASNAVAKHIGRSRRTVFRILEDYERVADAPKTVITAMQEEGFDPAELKNASLLDQAIDMTPPDSTPEERREVIRKSAGFLKQNKDKQPLSEDDQVVWGLRQDIRKRLNNLPLDRKWDLLQRAIAEEAYEIWGVSEEFDAVITPICGPRTLDGRIRQSEEVAA